VIVGEMIRSWWWTLGFVAVIGILWLVLPRADKSSHGPRAMNTGLSASRWVQLGVIGLVAGVGGLIKGLWYAAIFLVPSGWAFSRARRRL
jgi:hypothetical protein